MSVIAHYSVFAAAPGGGKQFAVVEGVDDPVNMQRIAAGSGAPLTAFILGVSAASAAVRFFSPSKEKGSSDSGALAVAEHLRRTGQGGERLRVRMGEEELEVFYAGGLWWSRQEDTRRHELELDVRALIAALNLDWLDIDWHKGIRAAGNTKRNLIVPADPDGVNPDLEAIAEINRATGTNGVVVFGGPFRRIRFDPFNPDRQTVDSHQIELRFFAPAKGIPEDNAGSYTLASLCGYLAWFWEGQQECEVLQGMAMGKPSRLWARYESDGNRAMNIQVGGSVEVLEVRQWA
ncbi:PhzF family phenazine biosynthesis protein [Meiothermus rufus]|uniref:PhzF family phenazine biosynthesis protein n=1 Tax=Meiothermus rufus TaxID=604332 RepID=UPI0003F585C3|nr:PhzF family phenazine biosynthesis protein [Meiothermus rufus]